MNTSTRKPQVSDPVWVVLPGSGERRNGVILRVTSDSILVDTYGPHFPLHIRNEDGVEWGYRTPNPGELSVEATDARLYGKELEYLLWHDTLTQEGIRRCAVSAWALTEIMDKALDPATPSLYRDLVAERDRWRALAESRAPKPGILARLRAYLNNR